MEFTDLTYQKQDGLAILTFNRPNKLNAFRHKGRAELLQAIDDFAADPHLRVLLLTGAGRAFSAGADLAEIHRSKDDAFDETSERQGLEQFQDITRKIIGTKKPIIAAINGIAVGVGVEIALACDFRLASTNAIITLTEVKRSLFQTNGVMFILPRLIGFGRAMEIMMTGRKVGAAEAQSIGLINYLTEPEQLLEKAIEVANTLSQNAPISLKLIKNIGWRSLDADLATVMDLEVEGMLECLQSEDIWEGTQSFLEKRSPKYKGK